MPAKLTPEPAKHEARKRRANERHAVGCCKELCRGPCRDNHSPQFSGSEMQHAVFIFWPLTQIVINNSMATSVLLQRSWTSFTACDATAGQTPEALLRSDQNWLGATTRIQSGAVDRDCWTN